MNYATPDLTQHPPRSARILLGGFVILARMLDKCRATLVGKNGDYNYDCPLDAKFLTFVGISAEAFKQAVSEGRTDGEMLDWISASATNKRTADEITIWSSHREQDMPRDIAQRAHFNSIQQKIAPNRKDLATWYDLHDLDDYVSFGGKS